MTSNQTIPFFALYGETSETSDSDFVHIEPIETRSAIHDWEIKPHRHSNFTQIVIVRKHAVTIEMDGKSCLTDAPVVIVAPAGCVHGFRFDPATVGEVLTLSKGFAQRRSRTVQVVLNVPRIAGLDEAASARLALLAGLLSDIQNGSVGNTMEVAQSLADATITLIGQSLDHMERVAGYDDKSLQFLQLIEAHYAEHKPLVFYARSLGLSQRSLGRLSQRHFDCSPQTLIHRRVIDEAARLLRYSNANIGQIAWKLGFSDASYFSRFYARQTGRRPLDERRSAETSES